MNPTNGTPPVATQTVPTEQAVPVQPQAPPIAQPVAQPIVQPPVVQQPMFSQPQMTHPMQQMFGQTTVPQTQLSLYQPPSQQFPFGQPFQQVQLVFCNRSSWFNNSEFLFLFMAHVQCMCTCTIIYLTQYIMCMHVHVHYKLPIYFLAKPIYGRCSRL